MTISFCSLGLFLRADEFLCVTQLESPKLKGKTHGKAKEAEKEEQSPDSSPPSKGKHEGKRHLEESIEELAKDIKEVKKQNRITHILLSAMIILTLTWQLSEYSMIFMLKDRISHPVRSIGGMLNGMFKGKIRPFKNQLTGTSTSKDQDNHGNGTDSGPQLQVPELLREFGFDDDEER
ncbi:uncharacterized protein LOC17898347 isoform X2 [Capsella rubella]|uniref:uncharacterized protein LOC17898347 isoform X2 n=1 Tax=Capsella rubella TaxID=81985 RepID=UPI000CD571A3|nr:uncharacterized protein LOC17898347 isoform X2 [Capsella rubella]